MSYHLDNFNNLQMVFLLWLLPFCGQLLQMVIAAMKLKDGDWHWHESNIETAPKSRLHQPGALNNQVQNNSFLTSAWFGPQHSLTGERNAL